MISLHSTGSPTETNAAYTLLAIIADPDAAKKRLDELVAEKTAAHEAMDAARAATKQASDDRSAAEKTLAEARRRGEAIDAEHAVKAKQLSDHEGVLTTKQKRIEAYDADVTKREGELAAREASVSERENSVTNRESMAKQLSAEAKALKDEYAEKVSEISAFHAKLNAPKSHVLNAEPGSLGAPMGEAG